MNALPNIELDGVSRYYATRAETVRAVDGITLDVEAGGGLAITGPSGCGKSTLLGLIAGLELPTAGRVSIGGREISSLPDRQRARLRRDELGLVFQSDNLQPYLTVAENVALQLALSDARAGFRRCLELLADLGLAGDVDKLPDELSGGQRQRVAIARALVTRPRVILADEPTGSLDAHNSDVVMNLLLEAREELGATLVVVTHDPLVARRLERAVSLSGGQLVDDTAASGTKAEIRVDA